MMTSTTIDPTPLIARPKIAVVGCGHGELNAIYANAEAQCNQKGWAMTDLDFLIVNGDFQAVRNSQDLNCMSVPYRYRKMGDFYKYYSGELQAPVLTIVIGGNHEASNYFYELYHGGWLAPNIYYLGAAGVIRYGPWRIAGLSGIYNHRDYHKPHHERLPYEREDIRSIYHVREYDVQKMLQIRSQVDIGLSHDWPTWVELFGDYRDLFEKKPHFFDSAKMDNLGSKPAAEVLNHLRPSYWFSGHMHVKFTVTVEHDGDKMEDSVRHLPLPDMWKAQLPIFKRRGGSAKSITPKPVGKLKTTHFIALDKIKSDHSTTDHMELMELHLLPGPHDAEPYMKTSHNGKFVLNYDEEWLAITRAHADSLRLQDPETLAVPPAKSSKLSSNALAKHRDWVRKNITEKGLLQVPNNFTRHAPVYDPNAATTSDCPPEYPNQQTAEICKLLEIPNKFALNENATAW